MSVRLTGLVPGILAASCLVHHAQAQVLTRESYGTSCQPADSGSRDPCLSADGRWVLFASTASSLVPNDANSDFDVFLRDRWSRTTSCISVDPAGHPGDGQSVGWIDVTPDVRFVAFQSRASNLVPGDTNGVDDVFVRDRLLGATVRVSVATGGAQANAYSGEATMSDDGRFVAFDSDASNLVHGDLGSQPDIFLHDRDPDGNGAFDEGNGTTICLSVDSATGNPVNASSIGPQISDDGRYVAFDSWSHDIVPGMPGGVFLWDRASATAIGISVDSTGTPATGSSYGASISDDGLHVSFSSFDPDLVPGDTNGAWDIFVRHWQSGVTELVSVGTDYHGSSSSRISGDGRIVAFETQASLVPADTDFSYDVYLRDLQTGTMSLPSGPAIGNCLSPAISSDGGSVAWIASLGMLPGDLDNFPDIYVLDRVRAQPVYADFCHGDGTGAACPCANSGLPGAGCAHSQGAAARLEPYGTTQPDQVVLAVHGEIASALTIFLQGTTTISPITYGDGLRCVGGTLKRLNSTSAWSGSAYFPACPSAISITARSAQLGDPIAPGSVRHYMTYYRDSNPTYCPAPAGNTWNASQAISLTW
jgi:hypothetical protein